MPIFVSDLIALLAYTSLMSSFVLPKSLLEPQETFIFAVIVRNNLLLIDLPC